VGKMIEIDHMASIGIETVQEMCRKLLANSVIENYHIVQDEAQ
jgi:phosphoribosylformylglycinamidine (FGAM) synthase PurS component